MAGSSSIASTVPLMDGGIVAEKSRVWRFFGRACTILRTLGQKPMSSMRSASSSTSVRTRVRSTIPRSLRSMRRPGVATSRSQPWVSALTCLSKRAPPMTTTARRPHASHTTEATRSICCASSRVGVMTSARGAVTAEPLGLGSFPPIRSWRTGSVNAAVLPVPVWAEATRSRPLRTNGMACCCTGVGVSKPSLVTPASICSFRPSSPNVVSMVYMVQQGAVLEQGTGCCSTQVRHGKTHVEQQYVPCSKGGAVARYHSASPP